MTLREVLEKVRAGELTAEQGAVMIAAMQQADVYKRQALEGREEENHAPMD